MNITWKNRTVLLVDGEMLSPSSWFPLEEEGREEVVTEVALTAQVENSLWVMSLNAARGAELFADGALESFQEWVSREDKNPNDQILPVSWLNEETYAAAYDLARDLEERGIRLGIDSLSPGGYALRTLRAYETPYSSS